MPELPEVETVVRSLRKPLVGRKIVGVDVSWARMIQTSNLKKFKRELISSKITGIERRGKFLIFNLENDSPKGILIIHLRMSGALEVFPQTRKNQKHDRVVFYLDNKKKLCFNDVRKFGRVYLVGELAEATKSLGPEPLSLEFAEFWKMLCAKNGTIKPLLLNQSFIAGIGNIYADECLWRAKLHPLTKASKIKREKAKMLYDAIRKTLKLAIESSGTDIGDNVVEFGNYAPQVYQRDGQACRRCKNIIKRTVVGQRGTHYCPSCQRR